MIPYFTLPPIEVGGVKFYWFMVLIVIGIAVGTEVSRARAIRRDLSVKVTVDCTLFMVLSGFVVAHWVAVLFYHPDRMEERGLSVLLPWVDFSISSIGGFLGAAIAIPLFLKVWKKAPVWAYLDNLAIGFVLGFAIGRTGCFTAHDHIGRETSFFLAVNFPSGPRHDLGFYEALLCFVIFGLFMVLDRNKARFHGFFSALLLLIYAPFRLLFDFLRRSDGDHPDIRYFGLTAAQYGVLALFVLGLAIWWHRHNKGQQDISGELKRDFPGVQEPGDRLEATPQAAVEESGDEAAESSVDAVETPVSADS